MYLFVFNDKHFNCGHSNLKPKNEFLDYAEVNMHILKLYSSQYTGVFIKLIEIVP